MHRPDLHASSAAPRSRRSSATVSLPRLKIRGTDPDPGTLPQFAAGPAPLTQREPRNLASYASGAFTTTTSTPVVGAAPLSSTASLAPPSSANPRPPSGPATSRPPVRVAPLAAMAPHAPRTVSPSRRRSLDVVSQFRMTAMESALDAADGAASPTAELQRRLDSIINAKKAEGPVRLRRRHRLDTATLPVVLAVVQYGTVRDVAAAVVAFPAWAALLDGVRLTPYLREYFFLSRRRAWRDTVSSIDLSSLTRSCQRWLPEPLLTIGYALKSESWAPARLTEEKSAGGAVALQEYLSQLNETTVRTLRRGKSDPALQDAAKHVHLGRTMLVGHPDGWIFPLGTFITASGKALDIARETREHGTLQMRRPPQPSVRQLDRDAERLATLRECSARFTKGDQSVLAPLIPSLERALDAAVPLTKEDATVALCEYAAALIDVPPPHHSAPKVPGGPPPNRYAFAAAVPLVTLGRQHWFWALEEPELTEEMHEFLRHRHEPNVVRRPSVTGSSP